MSCYAVTGAAGFLGRHLVALLLEHGHLVRAVVRHPSDGARVGAPAVAVVAADLLDAESLCRAVSGVDIVCHCAARLPTNSSPEEIWNVNVHGTANLVAACLACQVRRLVFVSTDSVYLESPEPATESSPLDPSHVYEGNYPLSKVEGEMLVMQAWEANGLEVSIVRPCLIYGPGASPGTDHFSRWSNKRIHLLIGGGACRISTAFVSDVAAAIELAAESPAAVGRTFNVTDGQPLTKREILETLARVTGRSKIYLSVPGRPLYGLYRVLHAIARPLSPKLAARFDPRRVLFSLSNHTLDISRIHTELGYQPQVSLHEGLRRTLAAGKLGQTQSDAESGAAGQP